MLVVLVLVVVLVLLTCRRSCWAFGTSESFSDRYCVATKGKVDAILSAQEATSCVGCMGKTKAAFNSSCTYNGCNGGQTASAWKYFTEEGLTTAACFPYGPAPMGPKLKCNSSREAINKTCADKSKWTPRFAKEHKGSLL